MMRPPRDDFCLVCGRHEELPEVICHRCRSDGWTEKALLATALGWMVDG